MDNSHSNVGASVSPVELSLTDDSSPIKDHSCMFAGGNSGADHIIVIDDDSEDENVEGVRGKENINKRKYSRAFEELEKEPEILNVLLYGEGLGKPIDNSTQNNDVENDIPDTPSVNIDPPKNGKLYVAMKPSSLKNSVQNDNDDETNEGQSN